MNTKSIYDIIRSPIITEKSTAAGELNKYIFKVQNDSTKNQIKKAIELIFNVKVAKVNTLNVLGKTKRFKGRLGKRNDYKKAIVSTANNQIIDISLGV